MFSTLQFGCATKTLSSQLSPIHEATDSRLRDVTCYCTLSKVPGWVEGHLEGEVRSGQWGRLVVGKPQSLRQKTLKLSDSNNSTKTSSPWSLQKFEGNCEVPVKASVAGVAPSCPPPFLPWIQLYNSWSHVQVSLDFHKWFLWVLEREIIVLMSWGIAGAQKWESDRDAIIDNDKAISLRCSVFLRKITMCRHNAGRLRNISENSNRCRGWFRINKFICKEPSLNRIKPVAVGSRYESKPEVKMSVNFGN